MAQSYVKLWKYATTLWWIVLKGFCFGDFAAYSQCQVMNKESAVSI